MTLASADEEALRLAADPTTPCATLSNLARQISWAPGSVGPSLLRVAEALSANPATPAAELLELLQREPSLVAALLTNPALSLLLLARPDLLVRLDLRHHRIFAANPATPDEIFFDLAERLRSGSVYHDGALLAEFARSDRTPPEMLAWICASEHAEARRLAALHPRTPAGWLRLLGRLGSSADLGGYAPPSAASGEEMRQAMAAGWWPSSLVARHPGAPVELLEELVRRDDSRLRNLVATNPTFPPERLRGLHDRPARRRDEELVAALATNPSTPPDLLERFAREEHELPSRVAENLLKNPAIPGAAVVSFLGSPRTSRREAAAAHPRCPAGMRALLARCGFPPDLSAYPAARPGDDDLAELAAGNVWLQLYVVSCHALPPAHQEHLAARGHADAASALVRRADLSRGAAKLLALRADCRRLLLTRPDLDDEIAWFFLRNKLRVGEAEAMVRHAGFSDALRAEVLRGYPRAGLARLFTPSGALLDRFEAPGDWPLRRSIARARTTPVELLQRLADDPHRKVRAAAVANPTTPALYRVSKPNRPYYLAALARSA